jgi:hypothetical protein
MDEHNNIFQRLWNLKLRSDKYRVDNASKD